MTTAPVGWSLVKIKGAYRFRQGEVEVYHDPHTHRCMVAVSGRYKCSHKTLKEAFRCVEKQNAAA